MLIELDSRTHTADHRNIDNCAIESREEGVISGKLGHSSGCIYEEETKDS
jgi:hypothetical protein